MAANLAQNHAKYVPSGLGSYNISLNLSAVSSLFTFPSRLLARIRGIDDIVSEGASASLAALDNTTWTEKENAVREAIAASHSIEQFPGPWAFFTSGYMAGLLLMAILMHRIPNVVVPPRAPITSHREPTEHRRSLGHTMFRKIYTSLLPLDLSRTTTRLAMHLPTLYYLGKMLLLWTLILLQTSNIYPNHESGTLYKLGQWSETKEMSEICWSTFCAVCAAFCVEGFAKGLDGIGTGFFAHMQANTSPFNLVGYAFLLHIYSSPVTHMNRATGLPSRPDKHAIITISIPLLQLTIFHLLSIRKRWSNHRLLPTTLSSFLSLTHFHLTLLSHAGIIFSKPDTPTPVQDPNTTTRMYTNPNGSADFPLLNYIPNIFETVLVVTIALTIILNTITQLLLTGQVTRPLLGLGLTSAGGTTNGSWSWSPPWDEDFGILLLRVGTASLEATGLRGWGNEVGGVVASLPDSSAHPTKQTGDQKLVEYGSIQMNRDGVMQVSPGFVTVPSTGSTRRRGEGGMRKKVLRGWKNEVRDVDVGGGRNPVDVGLWGSRGLLGIPGVLTLNLRWLREVGLFLMGVWGVVRGLAGVVWSLLRGRQINGIGRVDKERERETDENVVGLRNVGEWEEDQDDALYNRFLGGEEVSDDDGEEGEWVGESESSGSEEDEEEGERDDETFGLYSDLGASDASGGVTAMTILAHMTNVDGSPLTRRRYGSLVTSPQSREVESRTNVTADIHSHTSTARPAPRGRAEDESRRNCVVCTSEPRQIICWPCRCLTMCDDCRENLASRSSASKHRCPCCRRTVEGYSRIFIP